MKWPMVRIPKLDTFEILLIVAAILCVLVYYGQHGGPTVADREAIEARAQAQDARVADLVAHHKVEIGMTAAQCRISWGSPNSVNRTITAYGVSEQWVYPGGYLYFENGILRRIQN